jgi:hypothetical protein
VVASHCALARCARWKEVGSRHKHKCTAQRPTRRHAESPTPTTDRRPAPLLYEWKASWRAQGRNQTSSCCRAGVPRCSESAATLSHQALFSSVKKFTFQHLELL